jgi:8-oxo-dGTP diphosphatase
MHYSQRQQTTATPIVEGFGRNYSHLKAIWQMGAEEQGIGQSKGRYRVIPRVLVFVTHGTSLLLLKGAPDKRIWPNLYNGIGGHVERGEDIQAAALREIQEEVGLEEIDDLRLRGIIHIDARDPATGIMLFVFTAASPTQKISPSPEGIPEWVDWYELPGESLVPDLEMLLAHINAMDTGEPPFFARYWYDDTDKLQTTFTPGITAPTNPANAGQESGR